MDCSRATTLFLARANELPESLLDFLHQGSNDQFLDALSSAALDYRHSAAVLSYFKPLSLELCARWSHLNVTVILPALARVLPRLPHLSELAARLLLSVNPGEGVLHALFAEQTDGQALDPTGISAQLSREFLLALFRLLSFDNAVFAQLVKPVHVQLFLHHQDASVRYLAIRVICLYVHASDSVLQSMCTKYIGNVSLQGIWEDKSIDFIFLDLWEQKCSHDFRDQLEEYRIASETTTIITSCSRILAQEDMSPGVCMANGTLLLRAQGSTSYLSQPTRVVLTPSTSRHLQLLTEALSHTEPILLTGLAGSGKTLLVNHLAASLNKSSTMVTLHLNEQSDAKLLIGIYTTGSEPGSFKWQPGVLVTAVKEGRWVLIEDLDRAPNEVISVILPLIERRQLVIPSRGETITAAHGFRIIATMRTQLNLRGEESLSATRSLGYRFWRRLQIQTFGIDELQHIIESRYPLLLRYIPGIMTVYQRLRHEFIEAPSSSRNHVFRTRPISTRELFKWCSRMHASLDSAGSRDGNEAMPQNILDCMFLDAVDCLVGFLETGEVRDSVVSSIAEEMHVDTGRKLHLLKDRTIDVKSTSRLTASDSLKVGRAVLACLPNRRRNVPVNQSPFALTNHTQRLLEQVAVAVSQREPLLLVGETGIGKTTAIQHLSARVGQDLLAINLSQQSETGDLLGGFKPVNIRSLIIPLKDEFDVIFEDTFSSKKNAKFVETLNNSIARGKWKSTITVWKQAIKMADKVLGTRNADRTSPPHSGDEQKTKRRRLNRISESDEKQRWSKFASDVQAIEIQVTRAIEAFAFSFAEGKFVEAVRNGSWVLLDEVNLAPPDTLECISDLLEEGVGSSPSILLTETGNSERIHAHPNFRLFAAMNPATDVGKRDLPVGIRSRFTEIYVNSPDKDVQSLRTITESYLKSALRSDADQKLIITVADLYMEVHRLVDEVGLVDGTNQKPHYSLRTLSRALSHAVAIVPQCNLARALYEGFCMCFLTYLDLNSETRLQQVFKSRLFNGIANADTELKRPLRQPDDGHDHIAISLRIEAMGHSGGTKQRKEQHWLPKGLSTVEDASQYIITPFVRRNIHNLIRATSTRKYPVLIQGPTSAGKTSMIEYLAKRSGNKFVRINNHEHTDLQEYLGTYVSTSEGKLAFQEGVLVQAVRAGYWVVLDELNLAPTDVLEALNRLLDDNRELLIPETQEIVRPHPNFMLFATQNPVGPYGGRKALSRAFRNRFLELHFDDIPVGELNVILSRRSDIPESWCGLIVEVYTRLSQLRQENRLFEQNSFATLRDLFRWALRGADTVEELAINGYLLLAEKVRKTEERQAVRDVIEQVMSRKGVRVRIDDAQIYTVSNYPEMQLYSESSPTGIVWTKAMRRLYCLVVHALRNNEAVLLVGETGCGKTSVCQVLAQAMSKTLHIVNAHQNTETGDLIGAQRPVRNRAAVAEQLRNDVLQALELIGIQDFPAESETGLLLKRLEKGDQVRVAALPSELRYRIDTNRRKHKALFEWCDGSLVQAMRAGQFYLLDEISLADDSVLERLNSLLDPQRSILLAEKGTEDSLVLAQPGFQFFATMNPGGDFGKKELSPALRNRFTEIWVPHLSDSEDVIQIIQAKIRADALELVDTMVSFAKWFSYHFRSLATSISIRDILAWVDFINRSSMVPVVALVHGAAMVYIDTLGANPSALIAVTEDNIGPGRIACLEELTRLTSRDVSSIYDVSLDVVLGQMAFRIGPFSISSTGNMRTPTAFNFDALTTKTNAMRIVRALQVSKPILLEGSPGVGKTSIITAIASATGNPLFRINLSEQTDLMDLFGSDVPVTDSDAQAGQFAWRDAPFLTAMKLGHWVLLDEMNLASQSVLEGLNACLDHRGEVYVAELDKTFTRHPGFRLFAAQNPHHQGGGRKGLPASFVNRFTVVYADVFQKNDLMLICQQVFPSISHELISELVSFVSELESQVVHSRKFGARGGPWEFNLRDTLRWLQLLSSSAGLLPGGMAADFLGILFAQRFRTRDDERAVIGVFEACFGQRYTLHNYYTNFSSRSVQVGFGLLPRALIQPSPVRSVGTLKDRLPIIESMMLCVQQNWPVILVGSSGAGKTTLLQSVASMVGAELETFAMSADIDATDLVGGYEQVDPTRHLQAFLRRLEAFLRMDIAMLVTSENPAETSTTLTRSLTLIEHVTRSGFSNDDLTKTLPLLEDLIKTRHSEELAGLLSDCKYIMVAPTFVQMAKFEWIDGMLVQALEQGRWLVLDNANLCSSSVLDRLNSLLEPNGTLIINEHCSAEGIAKIVRPHANFRIFLTMDPQYGEVSRAMRNRAVELFVPSFSESEMKGALSFDALCSNSALGSYQSLVELIHTGASHTQIQRFVESFSKHDIELLDLFGTQIEIGLVPATCAPIVAAVAERFRIASGFLHSWSLPVGEFYAFCQSRVGLYADFRDVQSMHTLSNQPLVAFNEACAPSYDAVYLDRRYDLLLDLSNFEQVFRLAQDRSSSEGMNRLQRSFTAVRNPHMSKDSTAHVVPFFRNIIAIMVQWIGALSKEELPIKTMESVQAFLWTLFALVTAQTFEEAVFQMYLSTFRDTMGKAALERASSQSLISITKELDSFKSRGKLTTGLDMETLWSVARPPSVSSYGTLEAVMQLRQFADVFDGMVWHMRAPLAELVVLQRGIKDALYLAINKDISIEPLIAELEKTVGGLNEKTSADSNLSQPYFFNVFEALAQFSDLDSPLSSRTDHFQHQDILAMLACRHTRASAGCAARPLSGMLEALGTYLGFAGPLKTNLVLRDDLPFAVLDQVANAGDIGLRRINLLLAELPVLTTNLATTTPILCRNQLELLSQLNDSIRHAVVQSHGTLVGSTIVDEERDRFFQRIKAQYLDSSPVLPHTDPDNARIATDFLRLGVGCLLLYVPDRPRDPALRLQVQQQFHREQLHKFTSKLADLVFLENQQTSQKTNLRIAEIESDIQSLGIEPEAIEIARPPTTQLQGLQVEFDSILRIVHRVSGYLSQHDWASISEPSLLENVTQSVLRLSNAYYTYADITGPAVGFLQCLRTGLILVSLNQGPEQRLSKEVTFLLESSPFVASQPATWINGACVRPSAYPRGNTDLQVHALAVLALRAQTEAPAKWPAYARIGCFEAFASLYEIWKHTLTEEQKKAAANSSLYAHRGSQDDEDDAFEHEFQSLFPTFDELHVENLESNEGGAQKTKANNPQEIASNVACLHMEIFGVTAQGSVRESVQKLMESCVTQLRTSSGAQVALGRGTFHQLLPAMILSLDKTTMQFTASAPVSGNYNAYKDPNLGEVKKVITIAHEVQDFFRPVRDIWPEHATLSDIIKCADELLSFRAVDPIMKILTKAEKLHDYIAEWQSVTSKEHSATILFNRLTDLLISWRQLELSTWAKLMSLENDRCDADARSWWFIAYESVVAHPLSLDISEEEMVSHAIDVTKTLSQFISNSTIGQYSIRLQVLKSLLEQLILIEQETPAIKPIALALRNFLYHYGRFTPTVQEALVHGRKPIEKSIREVIQLASWRDRNISILKQSVRISHRKLFRCLRKYRDLLGKAVSSILSSDAATNILVSTAASVPPVDHFMVDVPMDVLQICQQNAQSWQVRPARYKNIAATVEVMRVKTEQLPRTLNSPLILEDFVHNTMESIAQLQKVTPAKLTEENATTVKHLLSRKRKLLADTLKELRSMGINSNLSAAALSSQQNLPEVLSKLPLMPAAIASPAVSEALTYLHKSLDLMITIHHSQREHSDDLNQAEINRCIGYFEGLISLNLKQRRGLGHWMCHIESLNNAVEKATNLWSSHGCQAILKTAEITDAIDSVYSITAWLPHMIEFGVHVLSVQARLGHLDYAHVISDLELWASRFTEKHQSFSNQPRLAQGLVGVSVNDNIDQIQDDLESFRAALKHWSHIIPAAKPVLDHVAIWSDYKAPTNVIDTNGHLQLSVQHMNDNLFQVLDLVLGAMQDVEKAKGRLPETNESHAWLMQEDIAQHDLLLAFHASKIVQSIESILDSLLNLEPQEDEAFQVASASIFMALPILQQYRVLFSRAVERYLSLHGAVAKTTYQLAKSYCLIASQGFCKPAEQETGSKDGEEKLEPGTGLGEGEGAEDISKDVADDEDLSELAQDPGDTQQNKEMEGEDDAVDIDDEMEGGAADGMKGDEGEEEEDQAEKDEGEQGEGEQGDAEDGAQEQGTDDTDKDGMDEGVGEIDDLEPSAVDEKLWDQAGDEEAKEKEGKDTAGQTDENEQAAGGKEEEKKGPNEEGQDDEEGNDGEDDASEVSAEADNAALPNDDNVMDPKVKDSEGLDLPDELQLDGDKGEDEPQDIDESMFDDEMPPEEEANGPLDEEQNKVEEDEKLTDPEDNIEAGATEQDSAGEQTPDLDDDEHNVEPSTHDDNPNADDMSNQPSGGDAAKEAEEQVEQAANKADARNAGPDQASEEKSQSESNAQRSTGAESQSDNKREQGVAEPSTSELPQPQNSQDREAIRKLGNILEKWHRQHKPILEPENEGESDRLDTQEDAEMADADFEHLNDLDAENDTQALGPATQDQATALDESMALQSELPDEQADPPQETQKAGKEPQEDVEMDETNDNESGRQHRDERLAGTSIGESKEEPTLSTREDQLDVETEEDVLGTIDTRLSTINLSSSATTEQASQNQWQAISNRTLALSALLTSHLRLILAPTLATKLRGDFRTGKRLNIKRIIPYIASSYKRDKIWMRRSVPSKRAYQVLLAIDDSKSMGENGSAALAFDTLALTARALATLEVGEVGVVGFGDGTFVAHELGAPWTDDAGARCIQAFGFQQTRTNVQRLVAESIRIFREARIKAGGRGGGGADLWQLQLIVSDGICEDHEGIRRLLLQAQEERIMMVFVVVDAAAGATAPLSSGNRGSGRSQSILDLERVEFLQVGEGESAEMKLERKKYLQSFPFKYYLIVKDVNDLPGVLSTALRQWFAEVVERG